MHVREGCRLICYLKDMSLCPGVVCRLCHIHTGNAFLPTQSDASLPAGTDTLVPFTMAVCGQTIIEAIRYSLVHECMAAARYVPS
jgi:hypothetical protein